MVLVFALTMLAASVKNDATALRAGCDSAAPAIATLTAGQPITIGFSLAGESSPCYKVTATVDGKNIQGYLPETAIQDLQSFDEARREAAWVSVNAAPSQPAPAASKPDPNQLISEGLAAWQAGDASKALPLWRAALDIQPNPDLEILYRRVEREAKNDHSTEKLFGLKLELRYEPGAVPVETARQMLAVLDHEFLRISAEIGCTSAERMTAFAQSPEAFRKTTDVSEWAAALFDGHIRIPVFDPNKVSAELQRSIAHEMTHACLALTGPWPAWLHEGLAQKLSGDTVTPGLRTRLEQWAKEGKLPRLANLRQGWSRLDAEHARYAYALSLAAMELFYKDFGSDGLRNLLRNPDRLPAIAAELDKRLGL